MKNGWSRSLFPTGYREAIPQKIGGNFIIQAYFGPHESDPNYIVKTYVTENGFTNKSWQMDAAETGDETRLYLDPTEKIFLRSYQSWNWNGEDGFSLNEPGRVQFTRYSTHIVSQNEKNEAVILEISPDDPLIDLTQRHKNSLLTAFQFNYSHLAKDQTQPPTLNDFRAMLDQIDRHNTAGAHLKP